jgi:hypothetical protein
MGRRGLQLTLTIVGGVAVAFGALTVITGGALVLDGGKVSPSIDSELRFYAAWYVGAGVIVIRAARRVESEGSTIRAVCAVLLLGGMARLLSIVSVGAPHPVFLVLMALEIVLPALLVPWQAAVARRGTGTLGVTDRC